MKAATYLPHPFTSVIECVILPVKRRYFRGTDNFLRNEEKNITFFVAQREEERNNE